MVFNTSEQNRTMADPLLWERIYSLCIQRGWNIGRLAQEAGVSRTTLHHWQQGKTARPRISTIYKLAEALEIDPASLLDGDEDFRSCADVSSRAASGDSTGEKPEKQNLFSGQTPSIAQSVSDQARSFDRQTNWSIQSVCEQNPTLFEHWTDEEWDELFSSFGTGGELNEEGIRKQAEAINARRETLYQLQIVLETHLAQAARGIIRSLYESIQCNGDLNPASDHIHNPAPTVEE